MSMTKEASITITVDAKKPTHDVDPLLYGVFLEEINYGGVGGIYAEKIQNRAFMDPRTPQAWPGPEVGRVSGRFGNAIELNGDTRNAKIALPEGIVSKLTDFTVAAWVKPTEAGRICQGLRFRQRANGHSVLQHRRRSYVSGAGQFALYGRWRGARSVFCHLGRGQEGNVECAEGAADG